MARSDRKETGRTLGASAAPRRERPAPLDARKNLPITSVGPRLTLVERAPIRRPRLHLTQPLPLAHDMRATGHELTVEVRACSAAARRDTRSGDRPEAGEQERGFGHRRIVGAERLTGRPSPSEVVRLVPVLQGCRHHRVMLDADLRAAWVMASRRPWRTRWRVRAAVVLYSLGARRLAVRLAGARW